MAIADGGGAKKKKEQRQQLTNKTENFPLVNVRHSATDAMEKIGERSLEQNGDLRMTHVNTIYEKAQC